ncbi:hypothetical protein GC194_11550 [bacterium]|nr:hypothetical protein [bacterium]
METQPIFGIYFIEYEPDTCYIKANKEGLALFVELLQKASDSIESEEQIPIFEGESWISPDCDITIRHIEFSNRDNVIDTEPDSSYVQDAFFKFGCLGAFAMLILFILVGFSTVIKWLFQ